MSESKEKIIYIITYAGENPEKASLPFVLANAARAMEVDAAIILQGPAVFLAMKGYYEHVRAGGLAPLKELMDAFLEDGGKLYVCVPCIRERDIDESDLIASAQPKSAAFVTDEILSANATLVY
jgi:predicted peroxiredoxin